MVAGGGLEPLVYKTGLWTARSIRVFPTEGGTSLVKYSVPLWSLMVRFNLLTLIKLVTEFNSLRDYYGLV